MNTFRSALVIGIIGTVFSTAGLCAEKESDPLNELPYMLTPESIAALLSISPSAQDTIHSPLPPSLGTQHRQASFNALTTVVEEIRQNVRNLGTDSHRFVRCTLKDGHVYTGAIVQTGAEEFQLRAWFFGSERTIPYRDLAVSPKPVAAVGAHLLNGLKTAGMVVFVIALFPLLLISGALPDC
jgi:hypothetical protein